jgi:hypothetical protein
MTSYFKPNSSIRIEILYPLGDVLEIRLVELGDYPV